MSRRPVTVRRDEWFLQWMTSHVPTVPPARWLTGSVLLLVAATLVLIVPFDSRILILNATVSNAISGTLAVLVAGTVLTYPMPRYRRTVAVLLTAYALARALLLALASIPAGPLWLIVALIGPVFISAHGNHRPANG